MAGVFCQDGEPILLDSIVNNTTMVVHLYTNNYSPDNASSTLSSFTEATYSGYAAQDLLTNGWNSSTIVGGKAKAVYASNLTFASSDTTPQTIYGYYLVDNGGTKVIAAEKFPNPITLVNGGQGLVLTPSIAFTTY